MTSTVIFRVLLCVEHRTDLNGSIMNGRMISPAQLRAARSLLSMTQSELSKIAGVSIPTLKRVEGTGAGPVSHRVMKTVAATLERLGVIFVDADDQFGAGVRLATTTPQEFSGQLARTHSE
jgi:transcriptional regulator with XRE-family HTH domain